MNGKFGNQVSLKDIQTLISTQRQRENREKLENIKAQCELLQKSFDENAHEMEKLKAKHDIRQLSTSPDFKGRDGTLVKARINSRWNLEDRPFTSTRNMDSRLLSDV